jgi:ribosome-binding ATPase YchF (GTP1/OBG family)
MKDVGIVGHPYSGKTTLFTAITRAHAVGGRANQAVVEVPDTRLEVLAGITGSPRIVPARVRFVDVPGGLTARHIAEYREMDALCIVVRAFGPDADPTSEVDSITSELVLADLGTVEPALDRAAKRTKGDTQGAAELEVLKRAHAALEEERLLRDEGFGEDEIHSLKGYGLLTLKPWVVVANSEEDATPPTGLPGRALALSAEIEAEVAGMDPAEAAELLSGFGITEPGAARVITACYQTLDLITFLTADDKGANAWQVGRGAKTPEAAGVIHSDMERGFIRAEAISFDDLAASGSWDEARRLGLVRVEGKDYVVQEGDVLHIRFAV